MASDDPPSATPEEIAEFMDRLTYWRADTMSPGDVTLHQYPIADGRILGLAKRALDTLAMWKQEAGPKLVLSQLSALLAAKLQAAAVDKERGRVEFRFLGSELIELRQAVGLLHEYALIRARDAREASRPHYPKRKR